MAIFGSKKNTTAKRTAKSAKPKPQASRAVGQSESSAHRVLLRPHVTEKAAELTARNVYAFEIARGVTKGEVKAAVASLYKVQPVKVAVLKTPGKKVRLRTRRGYGTKSGVRKAYVYLKKGDRIEFGG